jgi:gamma-glutamylcyclotransferase (GGCT)/AIG2-like uncharacterized protein YtfP
VKTIAVYGTLKKGYGLHRTFPEMKHLGDDIVSGYTLYTCGAFPAAVPYSEGRVKIEVYEVPDDTFEFIDDIEKGAGYFLDHIVTEHGDALMWFWPSPPAGWEKVAPNKEGVEDWGD